MKKSREKIITMTITTDASAEAAEEAAEASEEAEVLSVSSPTTW